MRIAYVCADRGIPVLGGKGASVHVRELSTALNARGHEVYLYCARVGEGNPAPPVATLQQYESAGSLEAALEDVLTSHGVGVVLERYSLNSGAARRASRRAGIPLVLEVNAPLVLEAARWRRLDDVDRHLANEAAAYRDADAVIVVSSALAEYVSTRTRHVPIRRIPNGADVERLAAAMPAALGLPPESVVVGFTGSMKPWHGVLELVAAFEIVSARHPDAMLVLAGSGPEEERLRELVAASDRLRHSVRLLGPVAHHDVASVLATFDVGVAPYLPTPDFYFSPLKIVEYLAAGLPVVFPRIGDLPEIVGDAGIGYDPGDPRALVDALERAIADQSSRVLMSRAARHRSASFTWEKTAAAVEDVLLGATARTGVGTDS